MKKSSKKYRKINVKASNSTIEDLNTKIYGQDTPVQQETSESAEVPQTSIITDQKVKRNAVVHSKLKKISALGFIMAVLMMIPPPSLSMSLDNLFVSVGSFLLIPISLRVFQYIRKAINRIGFGRFFGKIGSFLVRPHTRFWISAIAIGLCAMQVSPILIEIYGQNVGYDPDAYRRQQLSASAPGLDKYGNPSWLFSDSISVNSGWYEVTRNGRDYWEKIFSGKGNAYLFANIITETANISVRINSTTLDFECSYGDNYFSFSLSDNVDFYYVIVDKFYVTIMNAFTMIAVMPQVISEGGIDFTFSDDGDIDTSDIQWINFYGYGELTLLICPDFPMNSLYIGMDKESDGSSVTDILTLHPWGNGLVTDKGNEYDGTPMLYGEDYAELVENGKWPKYVIDIQSLGLYDGENLGLHKLGIAADIIQGADDYYAEMGSDWKDFRKAHVDYLILVDQDWDEDMISDSDELNNYDLEPTFPDSWGYFTCEPTSDDLFPQQTQFTFFNNYIESLFYITLYNDAGTIYDIYIDEIPVKTTEYSGGLGKPYFICTNTQISVGQHEIFFTFEGNYSEDNILFSIGNSIVYIMPELAEKDKVEFNTDSDLDGIPDLSDYSSDTYLEWDPTRIQQLILPTTTDKDTVLTMQIKRPNIDYYNLTHQENQFYLWNGEVYSEIVPIVRMIGNVLSFTQSGPNYYEDTAHTWLIRQPTGNLQGDQYYYTFTGDPYYLNTSISVNTAYKIGLTSEDIAEAYGKEIDTYSAIDYNYDMDRIGDSLAIDWDEDSYPDNRLITMGYPELNGFPECDNMEFDMSTSAWAPISGNNFPWSDTSDIFSMNDFLYYESGNPKPMWGYMGYSGFSHSGYNYPWHTVGPYPSGWPNWAIDEDLPDPTDLLNAYSYVLGNLSRRESQTIELTPTNTSYEFQYVFPSDHISKTNDADYNGDQISDPTLDLKMMVQWEVINLNYTQFNYRTIREQGKNAEGDYNEYLYYMDIVGDIVNVYKCYFLDNAQRGGDLILSCPKENFNLIMPASIDTTWESHLGSSDWNVATTLPGTWSDEDLCGKTWGCKFGQTDIDTLHLMLLPLGSIFGQFGPHYTMCYYDWNEPIVVQSIKQSEYGNIKYFMGSPKTPIQIKLLESIIQNSAIWDSKPQNNWGLDFNDIIYSYPGTGSIIKSMSYKAYALNKYLEDVDNEEHIGVGWGVKTYDFDSVPIDWTINGSTLYDKYTINGVTRDSVIKVTSASHNMIDPSSVDQFKNGSVILDLAPSDSSSIIRLYEQQNGLIAVDLRTKTINNKLYWVIDTGINDAYNNRIYNDLGCKIRADRWQYLMISFNCESDSFSLFWKDENDMISPIEEQNNYVFYSNDHEEPSLLTKIQYLYITNVYINQVICGGLTQVNSEPMILYTNSEYSIIDLCKIFHNREYNDKPDWIGEIFSYDNRNFYLKYNMDSSGKWTPNLYYSALEYTNALYLRQYFNDGRTLSQLGWTTSGTVNINDEYMHIEDGGHRYRPIYKALNLTGQSSANVGFPDPYSEDMLLSFDVSLSTKGDYKVIVQYTEDNPGYISSMKIGTDGISDTWKLYSTYQVPNENPTITEYNTGVKIQYGIVTNIQVIIDLNQGYYTLWIGDQYIGEFAGIILGNFGSFNVENNNNGQDYQITIDNIEEKETPDQLFDTTTNGDQPFEWDFVGLTHDDVLGSDLTFESTQFDYGMYRSGLYQNLEYGFIGMVDIYGNAWKFDPRPIIEYDSYYESYGLEQLNAEATTKGWLDSSGHREQMMIGYGPKMGTDTAQDIYADFIVDVSAQDGMYVISNSGDRLVLNPVSVNMINNYDYWGEEFNDLDLWDDSYNVEFVSSFISYIRLPDGTLYNGGQNVPVNTQLPIGTRITYKVDKTQFAMGFLNVLKDAIDSAPNEFEIDYMKQATIDSCSSSVLDLSGNKDGDSEGYNKFDVLYQTFDSFNIVNGEKTLTKNTFIGKIPVSIDLTSINQMVYKNPSQIDYTSEILDIQYAATDIHIDSNNGVYNQIISGENFKDYVQYIHEVYVDKVKDLSQGAYWNLDEDYGISKFDSRWTTMTMTNIGDIIWDRHSVAQLMLFEFYSGKHFKSLGDLSRAVIISRNILDNKFVPICLFDQLYIEEISGTTEILFSNNKRISDRFFMDDLYEKDQVTQLYQLTEKGKAMRVLQAIRSQAPAYNNPNVAKLDPKNVNIYKDLIKNDIDSLNVFARNHFDTFMDMLSYADKVTQFMQTNYDKLTFKFEKYVTLSRSAAQAHIEEVIMRYEDRTGHKYQWDGNTFNGICPVYKKVMKLELCHSIMDVYDVIFGSIVNDWKYDNLYYASAKINRGIGAPEGAAGLAMNHGPWVGLQFVDEDIDMSKISSIIIDEFLHTKNPRTDEYFTRSEIEQLVERYKADPADRTYFKIFETSDPTSIEPIAVGKAKKVYNSVGVKIKDVLWIALYADWNEVSWNDYAKTMIPCSDLGEMAYSTANIMGRIIGTKSSKSSFKISDLTDNKIQEFVNSFTKVLSDNGNTYTSKDFFREFGVIDKCAKSYIKYHTNTELNLLNLENVWIIVGRKMIYIEMIAFAQKFNTKEKDLKVYLESPDGKTFITQFKASINDPQINKHIDIVIELIKSKSILIEDWGLKIFSGKNMGRLYNILLDLGIGAACLTDLDRRNMKLNENYKTIQNELNSIARQVSYFFGDNEKKIPDLTDEAALRTECLNDPLLKQYTLTSDKIDLYILQEMRKKGYEDIEFMIYVDKIKNGGYHRSYLRSIGKYFLGQYDFMIETGFYIVNILNLNSYHNAKIISDDQYEQSLFQLNLGFYIDLASFYVLLYATIAQEVRSVCQPLQCFGVVLNMLSTVINTIYYFDTYEKMKTFDRVIGGVLLGIQWIGVAISIYGFITATSVTGVGSVLAAIAWACVIGSLIYHWRDPTYFNLLNLRLNAGDIILRNTGAIKINTEGSFDFTYEKGSQLLEKEHRGYITLELYNEDNDPYYFLSPDTYVYWDVSVPYTFSTIGCDLPLKTIVDFDVNKWPTGWQHNYGDNFQTLITVVEGSVVDFYDNMQTIYQYPEDYDNDGVTNTLEIETFHTDPNNRDTDDDGLSDGLELGVLPANTQSDTFTDFDFNTHTTYYAADLSQPSAHDIMTISGQYGWEENHFYKEGTDYTVTMSNGHVSSIQWVGGSHAYPLDSTFTITYKYGHLTTDPLESDMDDDGLLDSREFSFGTGISDTDSDNDGLIDGEEILKFHTDPLDTDTDNDGLSDYIEVKFGYDPLIKIALINSPNQDSFTEFTTGMDPWRTASPVGSATITNLYSDDMCYELDYAVRQHSISQFMDSDWTIKFKVMIEDSVTENAGRYSILLNSVDKSVGFGFNPEDSLNHADPSWQVYATGGSWTDVSTLYLPTEMQWSIWEIQWDASLKSFKFYVDTNLVYTLLYLQYNSLNSITLNNRYNNDIGKYWIDIIDYSWDISKSFTQFNSGADPLYDSGFSTGIASIISTGYQITSGTRRLMMLNDMSQDWSFDFDTIISSSLGDTTLQLFSDANNYIKVSFDHTQDKFKFKCASDTDWTIKDIDNFNEKPKDMTFSNWKVSWDADIKEFKWYVNNYLISSILYENEFTLNSIIFDIATSMTISNYNYDIEGTLPQYTNPVDYKGSETFFNFADSSDPWFGEGTAQIINMYQGHHKVYELTDASRHQSVDLTMNQNVVIEAWVNLGQHNSTGSTTYYTISGETHLYSSQYSTHPDYRLIKEAIDTPYSSVEITGTYSGTPLHSFHYNEDFIIVNTDNPPNTAMDSIRWVSGENTEHPDEGTVFEVTYNVAELSDYSGHYAMTLQLNNGEKFSLGFNTITENDAKYQYRWNNQAWQDITGTGWSSIEKDMQWVVWRISWLDGVHKFKVDVIGQDGDYSMSKEIDTFGDKSLAHLISIDYDCSENTGGFMHIDSPSIVGEGYTVGDMKETIEAPQIVKIEPNYDTNSIDFVWEDSDSYNVGVYYSTQTFTIEEIDDMDSLPSYITYDGPFTGGYGSIYLNKAGVYKIMFQCFSEAYSTFFTELYTIDSMIKDMVCDFSSDTIGQTPVEWDTSITYSDQIHDVYWDVVYMQSEELQYFLHERLINNSYLIEVSGQPENIMYYRGNDYTIIDSNEDGELDSILWSEINHPHGYFVISYQYLNFEPDPKHCATVEELSIPSNWYSYNPIETISKLLILSDTRETQCTYATHSDFVQFTGNMFIDMQLITNDSSKYSALSFNDNRGYKVLTFSINEGMLSLDINGFICEDITAISSYDLFRLRFEFNINEQMGEIYIDDEYIGKYQFENCTNIQDIKLSTSIAQSNYYIGLYYIAYGEKDDSDLELSTSKSYIFDDTSSVSSVTKDLSSTTIEKNGCIQGNYYYSADHFAIYDISTPSDPLLLYLSETSYQDVKVVDNFAYTLGATSISIYDLSNMSSPVIVNTLSISAPFTILDTQLTISSNVLYLLTEFNHLFVRSYDITDPLDILLLDTLDVGLKRDSGTPQVKLDTLTQNYIISFIEDIDNEGKIALVDISDPEDMSVASIIDTNIAVGFGCIATSFGYVYGSYVDAGANKIRIYDIINHFDPRLTVTKDISGSYPIYSMDIYENGLYVNRQTDTSTYTFEVYSIESRTNPTYICAVAVDTVGKMIVGSHIVLVSGTSKNCVVQIHYLVNGAISRIHDGQVVGNVGGTLTFPAMSQGIFGFDFVGIETDDSRYIDIGNGDSLIRLWKFMGTNGITKQFYKTPDYSTFDMYDSNYDIWGDQGYTGTTKVIGLVNPLGAKVYQLNNAQRSTSTLIEPDYDFYIESMLCLEKVSGSSGLYTIYLVDQYDVTQIAFAFNIADQKWYYSDPLHSWTEAELINQVIPTAMTYQTWKIVCESANTFSLYLDGIEVCEAMSFFEIPSTIVRIAYDDATVGADTKMWLAGYRIFVNDYPVIEDNLIPNEINIVKMWFNCPNHEVVIFINGELKDIYKINENLDYVNSVSFSANIAMDNLFWIPLDEDLDKDGLTSIYESLNSLSDVDSDMDNDGMSDGWEVTNGLNPLVDDSTGDLDGDSVHNIDEYTAGTSANCADSDHDYMSDGWEITYGLNPSNSYDAQTDANNDGVSNLVVCLSRRIYMNTYPLDPTNEWGDPSDLSSDGDTMADAWEMFYRFDPTSALDKELHADADGLPNYLEYAKGSNPYNVDTDDDGMWDGWEVANNFNPINPSDAEVDSDGDDFTYDPNFHFYNVDEFEHSLDPHNPDTDLDTFPDGYEVYMAENQGVQDADHDQMMDFWEEFYGFRPYTAVNDHDNPSSEPYYDGPLDDKDGDGLSNKYEHDHGTNPLLQDSDSDGLNDDDEFAIGTDPNIKDSDFDGLWDGYNPADGVGEVSGFSITNPITQQLETGTTNPLIADSDGDGLTDGQELLGNLYFLALDGSTHVSMKTNPTRMDSDGDGLRDGYGVGLTGEYDNSLGYWFSNPWDLDTDDDYREDEDELYFGVYNYLTCQAEWGETSRRDPDCDDDGLLDGEELDIYGEELGMYFLDLDGVTHVTFYGTNPLHFDSDGDGASDGPAPGQGALAGEYDRTLGYWTSNPWCLDTDGDQLWDGEELIGWDHTNPNLHYRTDPRKSDTDTDGIDDWYEVKCYGAPPHVSDYDMDGLYDYQEVLVNGPYYHLNGDQQQWTSNPWLHDTDGDGLDDKEEWDGPSGHTSYYSNPNLVNTDGDHYYDLKEYVTHHNPRVQESSNIVFVDHSANSYTRNGDTIWNDGSSVDYCLSTGGDSKYWGLRDNNGKDDYKELWYYDYAWPVDSVSGMSLNTIDPFNHGLYYYIDGVYVDWIAKWWSTDSNPSGRGDVNIELRTSDNQYHWKYNLLGRAVNNNQWESQFTLFNDVVSHVQAGYYITQVHSSVHFHGSNSIFCVDRNAYEKVILYYYIAWDC